MGRNAGQINRNRFNQFLASVYVNAIYEMKNYPVVLINTMLSPLSFLILIVFVSHGKLIGEAIEGGLIMSMFGAGTSLLSDMSHLKNDFKLQDMVVSSPASWQIYVSGMAVSEIVYSLPALAVLGIMAVYFIHGTFVSLLTLMGVLLMMFVTSIAIGYTFATFSSDIVQSFAFSRLISTLFSTIPPVYYPITYIPLPYRYFAYLSPTTYAAELAQNAGGYIQLSTQAVVIDWLVLLGVTLALFLIARTKARWREN
ncbi:MAG: ABC transporter permease [Candidatus Thermoplasmatota archaeon]|jgi:ABC-2 type transport system permease protein|nr:ABC transporter permease [Candidatus Sysuiplasma jiujiangense]MBX8641068.1 ABC transporter permease [Candidatus Sysuiplasma jiujiangense]MCL4318201.1 ABC transporter permease [Candidatus Thermoplasmatota archaeon]MCL5253020.1 ABC transporter permease [Candidatus Thermoplasmatota archaeon]